MLTNHQILDLAPKMDIPLVGVAFKDDLTDSLGKLQYNKSYIVNLENEMGLDNKRNNGTHWVCFQVNMMKNGKTQAMYFDSFGIAAPESISKYMGFDPMHQTKNLQDMVADTCGYWCLSWLHFINAYPQRSGDMYSDTQLYLDLFNDLNTSCDFQQNEDYLKQFFKAVPA